jgi:uncharacterized membrane protein YjjP (DUF1212 family)
VSVPAADQPQAEWIRDLAAVLGQVGAELLRAGWSTAHVEQAVSDISARYGMHARCFAVTSGLFVRVGPGPAGAGGELDFAPVDDAPLRLDQVQLLQDLVERMHKQPVPFEEVRAELERARTLPQRFRPAATVFGYALLTLGLGMLQHATLNAAIGYVVLGGVVGALRLTANRFLPQTQVLTPVLAAILSTALALRFAGPLLHEEAANLFIPPLIGFLPGAALTLGAIELATRGPLAGVSRLAGAFNILLLLALGIVVGTDAVSNRPISHGHVYHLGSWAAWCGVLALAIGFTLDQSAPARTLSWLTGALLVERACQTIGTHVGGAALGAFAAGMLVPLLAAWISRRSDIPDQVIFLPCFWLLVPGASGLSGFSQLFLTHNTASLLTLLNTLVTVASIALGILVGASFQRQTRVEVGPVPVAGAEEAG